ncbi:nucleotide sugar dehydrogenase [Glycomyces algeriensis]|uniref:UDP-N-acetyl-D-glucosamine dehydrogenase n=1 Tax=Glycomyces algeriensis TaxID=256037 RepID=A0A9W6G7D5_9ACTN|nr:nucleotide sugar dehydrogenase [Glycomyces algeriensis]MDA1366248.1 nucleotide sugar dehydrogenase [Glycomyces algeriensis]MDR7348984.1 nucleotide sugar dehydrogenase [Glycomyces algeriensis]GLI41687.1 UDP-N-acetyl-D-glucosamine dehydrogenase [Glycomyces algeriensis]
MPIVDAARPIDLVVVGQGYVGLPLAQAAITKGLNVVGLDRSQSVVDALNAGSSHIDDVSDAELAAMLAAGYTASTDAAVQARAEAIVICVPTPLGEAGGPDLAAVIGASHAAGRHLQRGALVVLESTTYPGTTEDVVAPILREESGLEPGVDFHLAFSPERVDPGNPVYGIVNTPKVVGGLTPACTAVAKAMYSRFIDQTVEAKGPREAEMAKLLENTYRHVNIALVNEMAVFCQELGVDLWDAINLAKTKPFGYQAFYPGPGVGGHCIPIDPNYLSYKVRTLGYPFRFVELAQEINNRMPEYVVQRAMAKLNADGLALSRARVLLLGVTYKPDIADQRESPSTPVARKLLAAGAELAYHDPHVPAWSVGATQVERVHDLETAKADLIVLLTNHAEYLPEALPAGVPVLDTRGALRGAEGVEAL